MKKSHTEPTKRTSFHDLCDSVFDKINRDYTLLAMDKSDAFDVILAYMRPAINMFSSCNQDLYDKDEVIASFNFELSEKNFDILSNYMTICYLDATYIRTPEVLQAHMSTSDFHKYDNNNVLGKAKEVREMYKAENNQLMINYSHQTSKVFEAVVARHRRNRGVVK